MARTSDVDVEDGVYLPSRRSPLLHQKMFPGPEKKAPRPLILDPLRPISAITWSDLDRRSPAPSTVSDSDSDDDHSPIIPSHSPDHPDAASFNSNRVATSHRSMSRSTRSTGGAIEDEARSSLPSLQRSPTPPGLPSKRGSQLAAARRASLPITPISPSDSDQSPSRHGDGTTIFAPAPFSRTSSPSSSSSMHYNPLSPVSPSSPANLVRTSTIARSMAHKPQAMEPVFEDGDADEYAETRSLQLPSPPASPDQDLRWRGSTSSSSSRRPSLAGRQSAPNALPFRPRSSTGPSVALPLTAAFQTSVLRSGSGSSSSAGSSSVPAGQRYPSITASPPPRDRERSRPSSVSAAPRPLPSPPRHGHGSEEDPMARPTEAFRRMSTTDIRHRQPYHSSRDEDPAARAFLRTSDAVRMPHLHEVGPGPSSYRHATVFNPPPPPPPSGAMPSMMNGPSQPLRNPLSPPSSPPALVPAQSAHASGAPRLTVHTNSSTSSHARTLGMGAAHPSAVTWKSLASGSRPSLSSSGSQSRSRSNSVRSVRTLPGQLPHINPGTPLSFSLQNSPEDAELEEGAGRKRRTQA
ncbi:hypothetical protein C8Q80DRAFT_416749 [Daedaleopsis nitida]|nr:hypothetical protein C8Q80DRAFT_416749 [Daedaleopsis nitida]